MRWISTSVSVSLWKVFLLDGGVVLDDPVVDQGQVLPIALVRVGIDVVGGAVRGPAGVSNAHIAAQVLTGGVVLQIGDLPLAFDDAQVLPFEQGHSGTVIPAVFQSAQAVDQDRISVLPTQVCHNATHRLFSMW
jgi:hypothetical protein